MTLHRYAARKDENQTVIVSALRDAGARVWIIGWPVDLLVAYHKRFFLLEVKGIEGRLTEEQKQLGFDLIGYPYAVVKEIDEALTAIGAAPYDSRRQP